MSHPRHEEDHYSGRVNWAVWGRLARRVLGYRAELGLLALSGLAVAAIDASFPLITGRLIDIALTDGAVPALAWHFAAYAGLCVGFAASIRLLIDVAGRLATSVAFELREAGFGRLQELSFSYYDARSVGWLVSRITADCAKLSSRLPWFAVDLFWGTSLVLAIVGTMFWLHAPLALVVSSIVPPIAVVSVIFQKKVLASSRHVRRTNSQITASFNECIMGVRTTKALVRERENLREFQGLSSAMYDHSMRNAKQSALYLPLVTGLGSAGVGLALWRGGVAVGGGLSLGTLVAFMQYAALLYMPIQELARRFTEMQSAQAAAERVQGLLDTEPEIADGPAVRAAIEAQRRRPVAGAAVDGGRARIDRVEFRDVSFRYVEGEPVLEGFDLSASSGQTIALVGPTGGGKSTIVSLLARFYEPTSGVIMFDGVDYRERALSWLQSNLGVVLQTPRLFGGSIRENIRYGRLDAGDDEVEAAARLVNAHGFVEALEGGYDFEVGEGGGRLSTGQRQLISLARAVLADPQIFIMDEATSSVDTGTEALIQDAVETVLADRLAFVIAHRLSTIRGADLILVIDGGRIVERGDHETLLARGGRYRALHRELRAEALRAE